jgi:anti-repressor protein
MPRKDVCMNTQVQFNTTALIPIHINESESEQITISARELHDYLEVDTDYPHWFQRMTEYGFTENSDFRTFLTESTGGRPATDAQITIDMAKQICMLQRSAKGSQARQYFVQLEKDWNTPEKVMARALQIANRQIASLGTQIESMKPKALFADAVSSSHTSILIGDLAKILKGNGISIGQKRLFEDLRSDGYLIKSGSSKNMPTQKSMELGLMEIKEGSYINSNGDNITTKTTKITGKGQIYFVNKFCSGGDPDAAN